MSFIHTILFIIGALFLIVPILILFIKRKRVVIQWAAYEWMMRAVTQRKKKVKVAELLKLISKMLLILALAFAFGRPLYTKGVPKKTLVIVDNTVSMGTVSGTDTRLDLALKMAGDFINASDAPISISSFDGKLHSLSALQENNSELLKVVNNIKISGNGGTGQEFMESLLGLPDLKDVEVIYFFSDFQKCWYSDPELLQELRNRIGQDKAITFVPVDMRSGLQNLGLTDIRIPAEGIYPGRENEIAVKVVNFSETRVEKMPVTLSLDENLQDRGLVTLEANESIWVTLRFTAGDTSENKLVISLPTDVYPNDDTLNVRLKLRENLNVLAVTTPSNVADFERDIFIKSSMKSLGSTGMWNYKTIAPQQIYQEIPDNYDLIILYGVPLRKEDNYVPILDKFMRSGKSVISFANTDIPDFWSGFDVVTGQAVKESRTPDINKIKRTYLDFYTENSELSTDLLHVNRYFPLELTKGAKGLLYLTGEKQPVLASYKVGDGKLFCSGFQVFPGYTDMFYNPNFIQWSARLIWDAMDLKPVLYHFAGDVDKLYISGLNSSNRYSYGIEKDVPMPAIPRDIDKRTVLSISPPLAGCFITIFENDQSFYEFGYNPDRSDSDIEPAGQALSSQLKNSGGNINFMETPDFKQVASSREVVNLLMIFLAGAVLLEMYAHLIRNK